MYPVGKFFAAPSLMLGNFMELRETLGNKLYQIILFHRSTTL